MDTAAFSSPGLLALMMTSMVLLQFLLEQSKLKWPHAASLGRYINRIYGVFSGLFSLVTIYYIVYSGLVYPLSTLDSMKAVFLANVPQDFTVLFFIYYLSKIWEYIDIILVTLQGYPINLHFRVHHNTTLLLAWALLTYPSVGGIVFMVLNTFMHLWVYLYFGGFTNPFVFYMTRIFGHVQLLVGMLVSGTTACLMKSSLRGAQVEGIRHSGETRARDNNADIYIGSVLPFVLYLTYFILFQLEIYDDTKAKKKADAKSK